MRPRRLGRRSLPPPPLRLPELPPALHFPKPTPDSPAAQPVNHAPGSRSPRGAQVSWAQVSPFFQRRTPRPINRGAGPQNATRGPGSKGGGSLLSPPFLQTWLPRSLFQNLAAQASAAPRKSRDRFPVFLWGAGFMGAGLPPRPSSFRRNLPFLFSPSVFVVLAPTSIIPAKNWGAGAPWPPWVAHSASTNRASRVRASGRRRVWRLSGESCARRRSRATIRIAALTI